MKKHLLIVAILFLSITIYAQQIPLRPNAEKMNFTSSEKHYGYRTTSFVDTIDTYLVSATGATIYTVPVPNAGYVFGTGYFYYFDSSSSTGALYSITDEAGIEFDSPGSATVTDILVWFGRKRIAGTADNIQGKIYSVGADSMPVNELASGVISTANIDTASSPVFTDIPITSGNPNINSAFFVSIAYAGIDDTIGIVSTANGDGNNEKRVRLFQGTNFDAMWHRLGDAGSIYQFTDVNLFIAPIVTISTGISNHFDLKDATLEPVFPSPANEKIHLNYTLKNNSDVSYKLFDLTNKIYAESKTQRESTGTYSKTLDVSQCAAGKYFLTVTINGNPVTQKVMVVK